MSVWNRTVATTPSSCSLATIAHPPLAEIVWRIPEMASLRLGIISIELVVLFVCEQHGAPHQSQESSS